MLFEARTEVPANQARRPGNQNAVRRPQTSRALAGHQVGGHFLSFLCSVER